MHMAAAKGGFREGAKGAMSPKMPNIVQHDTETTQCCMVCSAIKTPSMASNYAFHFHLALNFRLCTFKNAPVSVPDLLPGLRRWTPLGNFCPPDPLIRRPRSL